VLTVILNSEPNTDEVSGIVTSFNAVGAVETDSSWDEIFRVRERLRRNNNQSVSQSFFIYLHAELNSQWPITEWAGI
jgi:hypothetical protein